MRNKITLLLVLTLIYECHSGLIKDLLSNHHLNLGSHGTKRQSVNQGEPGTVVLVVKEDPGYGKPGYGGYGGPGHHHHHGYKYHQHRYDQVQGERPEYFEPKPGYGGVNQYPSNKPSYGGNQQNPQVPPQYGNNGPNYGGHRPGYGGYRPGYGGHRPGYGHHSLESNSASSEESSEELFGNQPIYGFKPPYNQGGGNFNQNQQGGNFYRPGLNNPNGPIQPGINNPNGPVQPGINNPNGPVQPGFGSGQYGNNKPSFNQVKPVYENPIVQPNIQNPAVQQPNINEPNIVGNKPYQGGITPNPIGTNPIVNPNLATKPQNPVDDPLFVPLDPTAEFNQNEAKRETNEKPKPAVGDDEEYGIDIRYGDNESV